jgi:stress-induced morphogen
VADAALKEEIRRSLEDTCFGGREGAVWVLDSDEPGDNIHVAIVSPKFQGKHLGEKADLIDSILFHALPKEEWGKITLSVGVTPEELREL